MNSLKKKWQKPVMALERFVANEYVTGCDFKWKYTGTEVKGNDIHEGTYNSWYDYYSWPLGNWNGDTTVKSSPFGDHDFLTNTDLGATVGSGGFYSTSRSGGFFSGYDTNVDDPTVFRYNLGGTYYYSGDLFERKRNLS